MDQYHQERDELRRLAERALTALTAVPPGGPGQRRAADRARAAARLLHAAAQRHPSLALAGGYAAGKTLLICLLTGLPGLLAVSRVQTTGNLTALRLHPAPAGGEPALGTASVSYLPAEAVADLARFVLDGIVDVVRRRGLGYDITGLVDHQPVNLAEPARSDWSRVEEFCRRIWHSDNIELRHWGHELLQLRDALAVGAELLPRTHLGPPVAISTDLLRAATEIGDSRALPAQVPPARPVLPVTPDTGLDAAALRATFPLIRQIAIDVRLPTDVWDFGGRTVELLDFPGLDSGSLRDRFLVERELPRASAVLIVLQADRAVNDHVSAFHSMLEQGRFLRSGLADSVLVAANRFDLVPVPDPVPDTVADYAASPVHETFAALHRTAGLLTRGRHDRVALTSALAATAVRGQAPWGETSAAEQRRAADGRAGWQRVRQHLAATDPHHPVTAALGAYCADGGLVGLRALIADHMGGAGLRIWRAELRAAARALRAALGEVALGTAPRAAAPSAAPAEQAALTELRAALRAATTDLGHRLETLPLLAQLPAADGTTLEQALLDAAAREVHGWEIWLDTLRHGSTGRIRIEAQDTSVDHWATPGPGDLEDEGDDDWDDWRGPTRDTGPGRRPALTTQDFHEQYLASLTTLDDATGTLLTAALKEWGLGSHATGTPLARAAELFAAGRSLLAARLAVLDPPALVTHRVRMLGQLVDPGLAAARLDKVAARRPATAEPVHYPLAAAQALPWHPALAPRLADQAAEDLVRTDLERLLRLRRDLVRGLHHDACRRLHARLAALTADLLRGLKAIEAGLPTGGELERMLHAAGPAGPAADPDPAADLHTLLDDPSWPDPGTEDEDPR
ncbi:hypothetical protein [Kitasatospora sp. NPDC094015]|uniref:hypothetical protein n=1 Tax=Kitasatospora sp. NPDC094015 TaxID=3155205 RepID=UPI00332BB98C